MNPEEVLSEARLRHQRERNIIEEKVQESAIELIGGSALRATVTPAMLTRWWMRVFDALATEDLVFTDTECDQRVEDAVYQTVAGDGI